ncbi:MAG: radical SAM protein, partial [Desulfobacterales bacterium]|nr:radical SAM protein [Desulfobacterales bacterium]
EICRKYGIMVVGGMIFGFPDDDEAAIVENYQFLKSTGADTAYCQILTPYPKTELRRQLLEQGVVTNIHDYKWYNGMWANVRTKHLGAEQLQYLFWYHRQKVMGWWEPSENVRNQGPLWTWIWIYAFRPLLKILVARKLKKYGWEGRYQREINRLSGINTFESLEE